MRAALEAEEITNLQGFRVTTALRAAEDLAREADNLTEAVAASTS